MLRLAGRFFRAGVLVALGGLCATHVGCDEPPVPPELQEPTTPAETTDAKEPPRPTTQELVSGPYTRIRLDTLPLTLSVPIGWKIEPLSNLVLLEGFTPAGQVRIQLSTRDHVQQSVVDALYSGARREADSADKASQASVDMREHKGMTMIERRSIGRPINIPVTDHQGIPKLDDRGQPIALSTTPMRWRINLFAPSIDGFDQYELNFIDLSVDQYNADREFLEKIIYSVELIGQVPATAPGSR